LSANSIATGDGKKGAGSVNQYSRNKGGEKQIANTSRQSVQAAFTAFVALSTFVAFNAVFR